MNTPIQFVGDSVTFIRRAATNLLMLVEVYEKAISTLLPFAPASDRQAIETSLAKAHEAADLDYLRRRVPRALDRTDDGLVRLAAIVRAMKEFAHPDTREQSEADLNRALDSALIVTRGEYKHVADLDFVPGELPRVICHVGDLQQVFTNIVVNASHAMADMHTPKGTRGRLTVRSWRDGEDVMISIADDGNGIAETAAEHIFEPFFTTKEIGRGTGQGLAISHTIVVDRHNGKLWFESTPGKGSTFFIRLPLAGR